MIRLALTVLTLFAYVRADCAKTLGPITDLHIKNAFIHPDGFNRSGVLAEGIFPGPIIRAYKGDRFKINVIDELTNAAMHRSTSIHWHGITQKGTAWADGPAFVSQCPIAPGDSFLYDFDAGDQAGTYWYHSHFATQYCDGLRGALIIEDPYDPHKHLYDIDDENTVITLADWYHVPAPTEKGIVTAVSTLINGQGRLANSSSGSLSVINVEHGKRYRFRLIAMACDPNFMFSIDDHSLLVIEADGVSTVPVKSDSIQIFAGQRYSFVLHADKPVDNYWVRANPDRGPTGFKGGINSAILRYRGAPEQEPTMVHRHLHRTLLETSLVPLDRPGAPGAPSIDGADLSLNFVIAIDPKALRFTINNASYMPPTAPVLLQILSGATSAKDLIPSKSIYNLPPNKVIQISIPGGSAGGPHPFHLHGHTFDVIRSAGSKTYNFVNPPRRDVVSVGDMGDNVTIRFVTDNAGPWFLHCHIDWHLDLGLAVVLVEDGPEIASANPVPESWKDLCPKYDSLRPSQQ